jgi:hypothetical protein
MGLLSASTTVVRFVAEVPPKLDRAAVARAITRHAFRDVDLDAGAGAQNAGWIGIHDPLATTFTPADLFFQHYLAVGFRQDIRLVPAKLLWIERRRAEEARKTHDGVARLGATARREIKDEVAQRLLARALPAPRLFDCVWNLQTGRLYFTGKVRVAREAFAELFRKTFGVGPVPMIPYLAAEHVGLAPGIVDAVRAVEPASLVAPAARTADVPRLPLEEVVA